MGYSAPSVHCLTVLEYGHTHEEFQVLFSSYSQADINFVIHTSEARCYFVLRSNSLFFS